MVWGLNSISSLHFQCLICKIITLNTTQHLFLRTGLWLLYFRTKLKEFEPTSGFARQRAKAKCQQARFPSNGWYQQERGVRGLADYSTKRYHHRHYSHRPPLPSMLITWLSLKLILPSGKCSECLFSNYKRNYLTTLLLQRCSKE